MYEIAIFNYDWGDIEIFSVEEVVVKKYKSFDELIVSSIPWFNPDTCVYMVGQKNCNIQIDYDVLE